MNITQNDLIFYHSDGRWFRVNELLSSDDKFSYYISTENGKIKQVGEIMEEDMVNLTDRIYEAIEEFFKEMY